MAKASVPITSKGDLADKAASFLRYIREQGLSNPTQEAYIEAIRQFADFLASQDLPTDVSAIREQHAELFVVHLRRRCKPGTVRLRIRKLEQFFGWLASHNAVRESPTRRIHVSVRGPAPAILSEESLDALLATCKGDSFQDSRDAAILRVLVDTGVTRADIADLRVASNEDGSSDVDLVGRLLRVRRPQYWLSVPFSYDTASALGKYLRQRADHRRTSLPWLWLGTRGRFSAAGILEVVHRRGIQAGLRNISPRQLRDTFARRRLSEEGGGMAIDRHRSAVT